MSLLESCWVCVPSVSRRSNVVGGGGGGGWGVEVFILKCSLGNTDTKLYRFMGLTCPFQALMSNRW